MLQGVHRAYMSGEHILHELADCVMLQYKQRSSKSIPYAFFVHKFCNVGSEPRKNTMRPIFEPVICYKPSTPRYGEGAYTPPATPPASKDLAIELHGRCLAGCVEGFAACEVCS